MPKYKDITGCTFNGCKVLKYKGPNKQRAIMWEVECHCGEHFIANGSYLRRGSTKSCGCFNHGETKTRLYDIWRTMKARCYYDKHKSFSEYGGSGIIVCDEWKNSYLEFKKWALDNGYEGNLTIDRIDNDGSYEPKNCRWVDFKSQARNRRNNVKDYYKGKMRTLSEIAELIGEHRGLVRYRYINGIDYDKPKQQKRIDRR